MGLSDPDIDEIRSLTERSRDLVDNLRAESDQAIDERRKNLSRLGGDTTRLIEQISEQIAGELAEELTNSQAEHQAELNESIASERRAMEEERSAWHSERDAWESVRGQVESELAAQEQRISTETQRLESLAAEGETRSTAESERLQAEAAERQRELTADRDRAEAERQEFAAALDEANQRLEAAQAIEAERAALAEKLERVLLDLGAHREHVARLEEELTSRPEAAESDAAELTQLRNERDELARHLEAALAAGAEGQPPEEVSDLTRRFEMAVEEVRDLKTQNADLAERLAAAQRRAPQPAGDMAGDDWESQKRRLLASLEGEGEDPDSPERTEERATITGTIQITDGVVAEKDREIEQLQATLAEREAEKPADVALADAATAALLDEDAVVQAERQRLADLEREWEEKLRASELELSLERAKITRAQSELAEQQIEIETLRGAAQVNPEGAPGESKRNWMNKLGLGSDGQG